MRVACICNMNNNFFTLTRYLRDRGVDAEVVILNYEPKHFHPSADTLDDEYTSFTRYVNWGDLWSFITVSPEEVRYDLQNFDFLIGCGASPAFADTVGINFDVLCPYGSEWGLTKLRTHIVDCPDFGDWIWFSRGAWRFAKTQLNGLRNAHYVMSKQKRLYERICSRGEFLNLQLPLVYTPTFNPENSNVIMANAESDSNLRKTICIMKEIRDRCFPVVFHHVRHVWKKCADGISWKGNDVLVRGFSEFVTNNQSLNPCLVMCEYGPDVDETKKLVAKLGIENQVQWLPLLPRKAIMASLALSDLGASEFHFSWGGGGTVFECLAMGVPVLEYRDDSLHQGWYNEWYPSLRARVWTEAAAALQAFVDDPELYQEMGAQGRRWYERHVVEETISGLLKIINNA